MIDLRVLDKFGSTDERLREIFTATEGTSPEKDVERRKLWEQRIANRLQAAVSESLATADPFVAVDLAWDTPVISKADLPLLEYAMGKISVSSCISQLNQIGAKQYVKYDEKTNRNVVDLPAFLNSYIPLVRSMVTRRLAAQTNKYSNLYPYYKYHPRSTAVEARLMADVVSEAVEQIVDAYGYRQHDQQVVGDALRYGFSIDFVASKWSSEVQLHYANPKDNTRGYTPVNPVVTREGLEWVNPHPTRVFKSPAAPWSAINSGTMLDYCGYWDVVTYGSIKANRQFFNINSISYNENWITMLTSYPSYWRTYYTTINLPSRLYESYSNDPKSRIGLYSNEKDDASVLISVYYEKIRPIEHDVGTYPGEVWVRLVTAGTNGTVIYAEFLPSRPASYCGVNQSDNRSMSPSFAMDMLKFQDQLTNLYRQILAVCALEQTKLFYVDREAIGDVNVKELRDRVQGDVPSIGAILVDYSGSAFAEKGIKPDQAIGVVQPTVNPGSVEHLFRAMIETISIAERIAIMTPNELGQPIIKSEGGVTATEASYVESASTAMYNYLSAHIDAYREAKKRIIYESWVNCADNEEFELPVIGRYPASVVRRAGLEIVGYDELEAKTIGTARWTVRGSKWTTFQYDYVFSSRDGSERTINSQMANILVQLFPLLQIPQVAEKLPPSKIIELVSEVIRMTGAPFNLGIDPEEEPPPPSELQQLKAQVAYLTQLVSQLQSPTGNSAAAAPGQIMQPRPPITGPIAPAETEVPETAGNQII